MLRFGAAFPTNARISFSSLRLSARKAVTYSFTSTLPAASFGSAQTNAVESPSIWFRGRDDFRRPPLLAGRLCNPRRGNGLSSRVCRNEFRRERTGIEMISDWDAVGIPHMTQNVKSCGVEGRELVLVLELDLDLSMPQRAQYDTDRAGEGCECCASDLRTGDPQRPNCWRFFLAPHRSGLREPRVTVGPRLGASLTFATFSEVLNASRWAMPNVVDQ